ncbi:MAG: class B sortase [Oscillospiraceae bacterium]|nr:class B sortase [Oscillospiraceae bacterium]
MAKKRKIIAVGAVCAALIAGVGGLCYFSNASGKPATDSAMQAELPTQPPTELPTDDERTFGPENGLTGRAKVLLQRNADTVGWITIPGTRVDNPIVQSDDNDFYLNKAFDHTPHRAGTVFMDYRDVFGFDEASQSDNIILYGHNMANNTMFGSLRRYRQDYSYYKEAPFIEMESNYARYTYVIFGLVITDGSAEAQWRYWDMEEFADEAEFNDFIEHVRSKNLTTIPVDVQYGDQLVTLSTCYSDADDSRFLVIGRRLRPGETAEDFTEPPTEAVTEEAAAETDT